MQSLALTFVFCYTPSRFDEQDNKTVCTPVLLAIAVVAAAIVVVFIGSEKH
jgi:hypothetical protein